MRNEVMIKLGFSIGIILVLLCLIGLSTVSASDSSSELLNSSIDEPIVLTDLDSSLDNSIMDSSADTISADISNDSINSKIKSDESKILSESLLSEDSKSSKSIHTITEENYSLYFDSNGNLINSLVLINDTINLSGNFSNKSFVFNIPLTVTSIESDAFLMNSRVAFINISNEDFTYDAIISNLKMENHKDKLLAVEVNNSRGVKVIDNDIFTTGSNGYPISLIDNTLYSIVANNTILTIVPINSSRSSFNIENGSNDNSSWQHSGITLLDAYYNQIIDNDITVENSYGVYLCYGRSTSDNNNISNNIIRATSAAPSFWAYGIYLMGYNNYLGNNTVIGMYRGISATYPNNYIVGNRIYNVTGADLDDPSIVGGDYAIYAGKNSLIANNSIFNGVVLKSGILVGDDSEAYGNYIQINNSGSGIRIGDIEGGSNSRIYNNYIEFLDGAGIELYGEPANSEVYGNIINSLSEIGENEYSSTGFDPNNLDFIKVMGTGTGVGILSLYQSRSKRPYNISIFNNTIYTSGNIAINIAQSSTESYYCENNFVFGKAIIYPMVIDYIPDYGEGTIYNVNDDTFADYFKYNSRTKSYSLKDNVKDGDTLIFAGSFSPKGKIIVDRSVNLISNEATLHDSTISIEVSNTRVQNFNIVNNGTSDSKCNLWGIYVFEADNNIITGNNISIWDKNTSYGIYLCDSVNDTVANNTIFCQGDNLVFGLLTFETYDTLIENNSILAVGTSELYPYYETICIDGVRSISELSKTYGVIIDFSSDNQFIHNDIEVTSTVEGFQVPYNPSVNILIGLYVYYTSNRNNISENNVYIHGHDPFLYGMGSSGDDTSKSVTYACDNIFKDNNITIDADYFAMGMILRHNSKDTVVDNNSFNLFSNNYTYGLTLEISQGAKVSNNLLNCTGKAGIYAVELYSSWSNNISYNTIVANGSFSEVGLYASSGNTISHNYIRTLGSEAQDPAQGPEHPDSVSLINTAILLEKGSGGNNIHDNIIETDGNDSITIDETSVGNTIKNNQLSSKNGGGDNSVNDKSGKNTITGNTGSKYNPNSNGNSNSNSNTNTNTNSESNKNSGIVSPIHTNGTSNSDTSDRSGSSSFGAVNVNLPSTALSSVGEGTGDSSQEGEEGDDLVASELEQVAAKSLSAGIAVPVAALLLVLIFCFAFLNAKDNDEGEE